MIFDKLNTLLGIIKIYFYKICYYNRIYFKGIIKIKRNFKISINKNCKLVIGEKCIIRNNFNARCEKNGNILIGDNCFINDNCSITSLDKIVIGKNTSIGQNFVILDHDHDYINDFKNFITKPIIIGENVWIGANVTILKGVKIGNNCVIAANTIITKDIPNNTLVYDERIKKEKKIEIKK